MARRAEADHSEPRSGEGALEQSTRAWWDARLVAYDRARFCFDGWVRDRVRAHGVTVDGLTDLHRALDPAGLYALTKQLCADTARPEFRRMVRAFVREEVVPKGRLEPPVAVQRFVNVRVMAPDRPQAVFPFHTGELYGHGPGSRSLWLPLTDVSTPDRASASLWIADLAGSRALVAAALVEGADVPTMAARWSAACRAVAAGPGDMLLFSQAHVHGNVVNRSDETRVSLDLRVAEERFGDRLARKPVGGYFALIPDDEEAPRAADPARPAAPGRRTVLYLGAATPKTRAVPVHLQRHQLLAYCRRWGVAFDFELFELDDMPHLPTLRHIATGLGCDAVVYSVTSLPEDAAARGAVTRAFLDAGACVHFANEGLRVADAADVAHVEAILRFARGGVRA